MNLQQPPFAARKTTWVALASIIGAAAAGYAGQISIAEAAQTIVTALLGLTLRSAIANQ